MPFDELAVTLEKREIPATSPDERDVFGPTVPLCFFLDLAEWSA